MFSHPLARSEPPFPRPSATEPFLQLYTIPEAARVARMSERLLRRQIAEGTGPAITRLGVGRGKVTIRSDRLAEWIDQHTEPRVAVE